MSHIILRAIATLLFLGFAQPAVSQATWVYRERTGKREIIIEMSEESVPGGSIIHSLMSDGETHDSSIDASGGSIGYQYASTSGETAYSVSKGDGVLRIEGTFKGKPLSRALRIDAKPWYQTIERSLREYALSGSSQPIHFWIVQPYEAKAYLLQARGEGQEEIDVGGRRVQAMKVRVGLPGIAHLLWSTLYWYRVEDGFFIRYEGVRGIPGTPKTVVELIGQK